MQLGYAAERLMIAFVATATALVPFGILFTEDDITPQKRSGDLCVSHFFVKESRLWWLRHLLQRPWRSSRFAQLGINPTVDQESTGGLDRISHLSRDDK